MNEKIPKRRFKGFSEDWEQEKLKDVLKVNSGRDYKHLANGDIPVYGTGGLITRVDDFLSNQPAVGLGRKGTIDNPFFLEPPFWTVDTLFYLTSEKDNHINFIFYLLLRIRWEKYDESTGVPSLSKKTIESINVFSTKFEEQIKIAKILEKINDLINLHKRKFEKLKQLQKSYLNESIFSEPKCVPKRRFKGFVEPWEQCKLGEVFKYEQPTKYLVASADYSDEYQTPVLTAGQSFILGYTDETEGIKNASKADPVIIFDDFTTGNHYVDFPFKIKSSALKILSISDRSYDEYFTFYSLNRIKYSPQNHQRHWISMFSRFKVNIPTIAEQASIGNLLRTIDNMITLHKHKHNAIKKLRKIYLQNNLKDETYA